jgi:hypothetical protein
VTHLVPKLTGQVSMTMAKVSWVGADGKVVRDSGGAFVQAEAKGDAPGSLIGQYPSQVSLAVSLVTSQQAATGRGRFFLPGIQRQDLVNGQMSGPAVAGFADAAVAFVKAVNAALAAQGVGPVVVASGGSVKRAVPAALRDVTAIRVGSRLDVIRSRANALGEAYTARPV